MFQPIALNLPSYPFKVKHIKSLTYIFDDIRGKYLLLTPEEWVRQHFVKYLTINKKYPKSLIHVERGVELNNLHKRTDILLFNAFGKKILLVECKNPFIKISQSAFDQVSSYNIAHRISLLAVTNGLQHYFCKVDFSNASYHFIKELPDYQQVCIV